MFVPPPGHADDGEVGGLADRRVDPVPLDDREVDPQAVDRDAVRPDPGLAIDGRGVDAAGAGDPAATGRRRRAGWGCGGRAGGARLAEAASVACVDVAPGVGGAAAPSMLPGPRRARTRRPRPRGRSRRCRRRRPERATAVRTSIENGPWSGGVGGGQTRSWQVQGGSRGGRSSGAMKWRRAPRGARLPVDHRARRRRPAPELSG